MPLNTLAERISTDAKEEAKRIVAKAKETAALILEEAEAAAELSVTEAVGAARREAEQQKKRKLAAANLSARDDVIAAKQEIISQAFARARSMLDDLPTDEYAGVLASLIAKRASGGEEIIFSPADAKIAERVIKEANEILLSKGAKTVAPAAEARNIGRGFVIRLGKVEESFAFDALLRAARDSLEAEIAAMIFGAAP